MSDRHIKQVKVSKVFWKDLGKARKKTEYLAIRKSIAKMIQSAFEGKEINDRTFQNPVWERIAHIKTPGKLILFTRREADETLALAGLRKHDSYGYKNCGKAPFFLDICAAWSLEIHHVATHPWMCENMI